MKEQEKEQKESPYLHLKPNRHINVLINFSVSVALVLQR